MYVCVCVCASVCARICVFSRVCMCMCVCVLCVCACVRVYACVSVCVHPNYERGDRVLAAGARTSGRCDAAFQTLTTSLTHFARLRAKTLIVRVKGGGVASPGFRYETFVRLRAHDQPSKCLFYKCSASACLQPSNSFFYFVLCRLRFPCRVKVGFN